MWVGALAMRRWRAQFKLFALVLAVAVIAGSVLAGSLLLVRSAEEAGVRDSLASMAGEQVDVTIRMIGPQSPVADTRKALDNATAQAYGDEVSWSSTGWVTSNWLTNAASVYAYLVELDDPAAAAELVAGQWPTSGLGIAMPEVAARSLGLVVGDTFTLVDDRTPIDFHVDGLYRSSQPDLCRCASGCWIQHPRVICA
ncbi:hypothetical protein DC31_11085 [Microbacterium sp. CH12i]|uniref:hypothetical protein n=1 Tax=Microbacterium sp. CH12i TaxID=1479651 RepID=UPI000462066C|nr:hypothetical protein [Microbacterium sp. CH12i]KDA06394.1 hypothetical protein DC31_11085 [Microbacterium sp. CH12i]